MQLLYSVMGEHLEIMKQRNQGVASSQARVWHIQNWYENLCAWSTGNRRQRSAESVRTDCIHLTAEKTEEFGAKVIC